VDNSKRELDRPAPGRAIAIVCHKGANEYAPENTFAAAQLCMDWGMDYVEIDVSTSKDGVLYILHGPTLDRTTNGTGPIANLTSAEIDSLDAGSWFGPGFVGEKVPRLEPYLRSIKGRIKVFLDVKAADPQQLIDVIYALGLERDCFFWSGSSTWMVQFRAIDQDLQLKINVESVADVIQAHELYRANIVEVGLDNMSDELLDACRQRGLRVMIYHPEKDPRAFRDVLRWGVDMVNVDHGDLFARVASEFVATQVLAICIDFGDTLIDEQSEVKDDAGTTLRAELIPGAGEMVRALSQRGYRLALVADGRPGTYANVLRQHGITDLFDAFAISEELGVEKPHARMFVHALDQLGIAQGDYGRVVMVGNTLERDIEGANRLGMISVWLDWAPRRSKVPANELQMPDFTIKMPLELLSVIEALECESFADG